MLVKGVIGANIKAATGAVGVVIGETLGRKIRGAAQGMLPASVNVSTGWNGVATSAGAAVAVTVASTLVPAKFRRFAEFVAVGAWAEAINQAAAQTPAAAFMRGAPVMRIAGGRGVRGYVQDLPRRSIAGYVRSGVAGYARGASQVMSAGF